MRRRFRRFAFLVPLLALSPALAVAKVDVGCGANATSAVGGLVTNVSGSPVSGVAIELRAANSDTLVASTSTDPLGQYRLCAPHNTYDVRADTGPSGAYAIQNRTITTFSDPVSSVNFVLEYKLFEIVSPQAVSIPLVGSQSTVTWKVKSKAPASTQMRLTLDHNGSTVFPSLGAPESGWNVWTYSAQLAYPLGQGFFFSKVAGYDGSNSRLTELGQEPYLVDNEAPLFGPAATGSVACGGSQFAGPLTPSQTTNPWALISMGVCDPESNGGRSSLDPYSVKVDVLDPANNPVTTGGVVLNQLWIQYLPAAPFQLGTYKFRYTIKDHAGNQTVSGWYNLLVETTGGSVPTLTGFTPGNLGEGQNLGIVVGSTLTSPTSRAVVAFQVRDADGQGDLAFGSLRVRIYGPDGRTQLYDYDSTLPPICSPTPAPAGNTGCFNQGTGRFEATGFSLVGKPPGFYVATASVSDHSGNSVTKTWRWIQVLTL